MANKFLLVNNKFLWSSSVQYHFELLPENVTRDKTAGGGWWYLDRKTKKFILFSKSEDFGYAKKEDIIKSLERTLFPAFMNGVGFYITRFDNLADAIVYINEQNVEPDWIYDETSQLVVDDIAPSATNLKKESKFTLTGDTHFRYMQRGTPIVKDKKIGRNEPCSCGSGKKNKRCCNT